MCGIAGYFGKVKLSREICEQTLDSLAHRGPDGSDYTSFQVNDSYLHLFHTRLAIIELSDQSNQPFVDESGRYSLVFNGEIYNYEELREKIRYKFRTQSDTEVLLAYLIKYGSECLKILNGMFAFAFFDKVSGELLISRDRFGKKPLYFYRTKDTFIFASNVKTVLKFVKNQPVVSFSKVMEWLQWQSVLDNGSLIEGVSQIEPGSVYKVKNGEVRYIGFYHSFTEGLIEKEALDYESILFSARLLIKRSVELRLRSDVPVAVLLSGGVDSRIISGVASEILDTPINTVTMAHSNDLLNESHIANIVSSKLQTNHYQFNLDSSIFKAELSNFINSIDHPSTDGFNTFLISKFCKKNGFKVILNGIGGDEWFLGYDIFSRNRKLNSLKYLSYLSVLNPLLDFKTRKAMDVLNGYRKFGVSAMVLNRVLFDRYTLNRWFNHGIMDYSCKGKVDFSSMMIDQFKVYTMPVLLRDSDQYSMANSVEIRSPFMDDDLVDFALSIDESIKVKSVGKIILKEAFPEYFNDDFAMFPVKRGFNLPMEQLINDQDINALMDANILQFAERLSSENLFSDWKKYSRNKNKKFNNYFWSIFVLNSYLNSINATIE